MIPTLVRKSSNLSEDSNDPKRRRNVLGAWDSQNNPLALLAGSIPLFGQSINEEPFQSDDDLSNSDNDSQVKRLEETTNLKEDTTEVEGQPLKSKTNFFVHRRVKNDRKSILANRPLTIFKTNTRKDSVFRFFSPPPQTK